MPIDLLDGGLHEIDIRGTKFVCREFSWWAECNWISFLQRGKSEIIGTANEGLRIQSGGEVRWITKADESRLIDTLASSVVSIEPIEGYEDLFTVGEANAKEVRAADTPGRVRDVLRKMRYPDLLALGIKISELVKVPEKKEQD